MHHTPQSRQAIYHHARSYVTTTDRGAATSMETLAGWQGDPIWETLDVLY